MAGSPHCHPLWGPAGTWPHGPAWAPPLPAQPPPPRSPWFPGTTTASCTVWAHCREAWRVLPGLSNAPSLPQHPPCTQPCGVMPPHSLHPSACSFWIIMSGCRDKGRVWAAGPRAPNPPVHSFSVPSMFLGMGPTVYFQSRHSEHSAPPRAQTVTKDAQGKEMSQLAGSTGLGRDALYSQQTPDLKGRPGMVDHWQDKACFVLHAGSSMHFRPVPFLTGASDT